MVVSLTRMLKSLAVSPAPLKSDHNATTPAISDTLGVDSSEGGGERISGAGNHSDEIDEPSAAGSHLSMPSDHQKNQQLSAPKSAETSIEVNNRTVPTPLTDRYLANKRHHRSASRPPFDPNTLWYLKHGRCPIMTELIHVVDEPTLNAMPIEAVAILDRINHKLRCYREWSDEIDDHQDAWFCERQFVIDKLITESIPEALKHYEQLLRFSPHRTKNRIVQDNMTAGDILTDLFLKIDYELDELLEELHNKVLSRLASTHRYVKSRIQS